MEAKLFDLGLIDFKSALEFQKKVWLEVKSGLFDSAMILCQHYPVITLGRSARKENIRALDSQIKDKGIAIYEAERGGDVTYHGPGQLVVYPIVNLACFKKDIHLFLRNLEDLAIRLLNNFGLEGEKRKGFTGVWINDKKIVSVGVAVKNWITYHGLAINIKRNDLDNFSLIRPCGLDISMTSLESLLDRKVPIELVKSLIGKEVYYG